MKTKVKLKFIWFDFWMGLFLDVDKAILYIGLLPMVILIIQFKNNFYIDLVKRCFKSFKSSKYFYGKKVYLNPILYLQIKQNLKLAKKKRDVDNGTYKPEVTHVYIPVEKCNIYLNDKEIPLNVRSYPEKILKTCLAKPDEHLWLDLGVRGDRLVGEIEGESIEIKEGMRFFTTPKKINNG